MMVSPQEIRRVEGSGLLVRWSDGLHGLIPAQLLRTNCPCASCKEKRGEGAAHERPLTAQKRSSLLKIVDASIESELNLLTVFGVGNYAVGLRWADGHDTGIYTFAFLRELAEKAKTPSPS